MSVPTTLSDLERRNARSQFFGGISTMTLIPFDLKRTNWARYHVRKGVFLGVLQANVPNGRIPTLPNFGISWQNDQIRRGNTYEGGRVLGSATPLNIAEIRRAVCQRQRSFLSFFCYCFYRPAPLSDGRVR